jgi:hypothetical protein
LKNKILGEISLKSMSKCSVIGIFCLALSFLLIAQLVSLCYAADFDEADDAVETAERNVASAFIAVAIAEDAGADVSGLKVKLDSAGSFLSEAHFALSVQDYDAAVAASEAANSVVEGLANDAAGLSTMAEESMHDWMLYMLVGSGVSVASVVVCAFFGWKLLKRRYSKR